MSSLLLGDGTAVSLRLRRHFLYDLLSGGAFEHGGRRVRLGGGGWGGGLGVSRETEKLLMRAQWPVFGVVSLQG